MVKFLRAAVLLVATVFLSFNVAKANVTVTVTYTGTAPGGTLLSGSPFSSLGAAITALNSATFTGTTGVTLTCGASGAETAPIGGYSITASGSGTCAIIINGNSSTITAYSSQASGSVSDAIFKLVGTSYVTLENFTMQESSANTTTTLASNNMTEWGVALLVASATKGCQYNTIQGNTISLNNSYSNTFGIYSNTNHTTAGVTSSNSNSPSSALGTNSNNTIIGNTISNINVPISFSSSNAYFDAGNTIGASGTPNTISNWGGAAYPATQYYLAPGYSGYQNTYGIFLFNQNSVNCNYNALTTNIATGTATSLYGIYCFFNLSPGGTPTLNINNNTFGSTSANSGLVSATTSNTYPVYGIYTYAYSGVTLNISYNTFQNCAITGASSSAYFYGIQNAGSGANNLYITNNTFANNSTTGTSGGFYGIYNNGNAVSGNIYMNSNTISQTFSAVNFSTSYGIYCAQGASTATLQIESNTFQNFNFTNAGNSSCSLSFIDNSALTLNQYILSNNFNNLILPTTGSIYLIQDVGLGAAGTKEINSNYTTTGLSAASTGFLYFIFDNGSTPAGSTVQYESNNFSNVNNVGTGTIYGLELQDGTSSAKTITGNTLNNITSLGGIYGMYVSGTGANTLSTNALNNINASGTLYGLDFNGSGGSNTISSNTINALLENATGYVAYGIYTNGGAVAYTISGNTITNITTQNQSVYGIDATNAGALTVSNNTIDYIVSGSGSPVAIASAATGANIISGNTIYSINSGGTSVTGIGISVTSTTAASSIYNNSISNSYAVTGNFTGISFAVPTTASTTHYVYGNTISGISNTTGITSDVIVGIYLSGGVNTSTVDVYQNKIYNLSGLLTPPYGIEDNCANAVYAYNNVIGGLTSTAAVTPAVLGIAEVYSSTSNKFFYYNTVYLSGSLSGAAVSAALYTVSNATPGTCNLTLADNILINDMTPSTGKVYSLYRAGATSFANYNANSNNNLFYAGTPGTKNLICLDNATSYQTLALYQAAVTTKDNHSISLDEASNFISTAGSNANYLNLNPGSSNGCYNTGLTEATTVTTDYAGVTRAPSSNAGYTGTATAPTIGAYEIIPATNAAGVTAIITPASLCAGTETVQATLTNTGTATLTSATITWTVNGVAQTNAVLTGISIAPGASANENLGSYTFSTGSYVISATVTLANAVTNGYAAAATGSGTFSFGLNGVYTVGATGYSYTNLTAAIQAYNAAPICGNVTFLLESNYSSSTETYPLNILPNAGATGSSHFTLTIEPDASVTQTISGTSGAGLFLLNGAAYVTINGAPGGIGSAQNLTISNSNTNSAAILVAESSTNITLENSVINANAQTSATYPGVVYVGSPFNAANSTIYIQNNTIASNSVLAAYGVYLLGTSTYSNTGVSITGNTISNFGTAAVYDAGYSTGEVVNNNTISNNYGLNGVTYASTTYGIYCSAHAGAVTISGNSISGTGTSGAFTAYGIDYASTTGGTITNNSASVFGASASTTYGIACASTTASTITGNSVFSSASSAAATQYGIDISTGPASGTGHSVHGNYIGGSAASASGTWTNTYSGATFYGIYYVKSGSTAVANIFGNTVSNISLTSTGANGFTGIQVNGGYAGIGASGGGGNTISNITVGTAASAAANIFYGIFGSGSGVVHIRYNTVTNITCLSTGSAVADLIAFNGTGSGDSIIYNNLNNLTSNSQAPMDISNTSVGGTAAGIVGIEITSTAGGFLVGNNTINTLVSNAASSTTYPAVLGISSDNGNTAAFMYANKIYDLENNSTNTTTALPGIAGIRLYGGLWSVYNNQIILTNTTLTGTVLTNNVRIYGINEQSANGNNYYFNSVFIGGAPTTGSAISSAWDMCYVSSTVITVKNNLFYNVRTNGGTASGNNYAMTVMKGGTGTAPGTAVFTSNYNDLYSAGTAANYLGEKGSAGTNYTNAQIATWATTTPTGDANSLSQQAYFSQSNPPTSDLTPSSTSNCLLYGKGLAVTTGSFPPSSAGIPKDYAATTRPTPPNVGAVEFTNSFPSISAGSPQSTCSGSTVTLAGTHITDGIATGAWTPTAGLTYSGTTLYNSTVSGFATSPGSTLTWTVTDGSCSGNANVIITGTPLPTATVTGGTTACVGGASPNVTFTAAGSTTTPFTFTYNINGTGTYYATTSGSNTSVNVAVPTTSTGTLAYNLVSVADGNATPCTQSQSGSTSFAINNCSTPTLNAGTISGGFGTICLGNTSAYQTFSLSGVTLTSADIFVGPLTGFTFSTDNITYSNSLDITQSGGTYGPITIYVEFNPASATSYSGNIPVSGGGASSISVAETATGVGMPAITPGTNPSVCYSASSQTANLAYTSPTNSPATYSISGWSGGSFANVINATLSGGTIGITVPAATTGGVTYNASLVVANAGCSSSSYSVSVTVNALPTAVTVTPATPVLSTCTPTITLNATGGTGGTIYYQGNTSNGISTATPSTSQSISAAGTYYFNAANAGCWGPQGSSVVTTSSGLGGTYTIPGSYATLTLAVAAYNAAPICGPVVFQLGSTYLSTGETFPITIKANTGASSVNTLTIEPASGATPTITGSNATAIIELQAANYVYINGAAGGTGTTPALTIANTNTGTSSAVVYIASTATVGTTNSIIENCIINGHSSATTLAGIFAGGTTVNTTAAIANSGNTVQNNTITTAQYGVLVNGATDLNWLITGNTIGSAVTANMMKLFGIDIYGVSNFTISNNTVSGVTTATATDIGGIGLGYEGTGSAVNGLIYGNRVSNVTNTDNYGCQGIWLAQTSTTANITIYNNYIFDISGAGASGSGDYDNAGNGIDIYSGGGYNIYFNTIYQNVNQTAACIPTCIYVESGVTTTGAINLENNILVNTETVGTAYAIYCAVAKTVFGTIDYNDYFATNGMGNIGGNAYNTLANMITKFGGNTHSISSMPSFVSTTNLNLNSSGNSALVAGITIGTPSITTDITGATRASTPTIGAFEVLAGTVTLAAANNPTGATYQIGSVSSSGGANNATLSGFSLTGSVNGLGLSALSFTTAGGASTSDYNNFILVRDVNQNGIYDAGDVLLGTVATLSGTLSFTGLNETLTTSATDYLLLASVECSGTAADILTASIAANSTGITSGVNTIAGSNVNGANMVVGGTLPATPGNPTSNSPNCTNVTITESGSPAGGINWYWESSATGTATANSAATAEVETAAGTYYIRATTALGCWSTGAGSATIVVNPNPQGSITIAPVCSGTNGTLTWTSTTGTGPFNIVYNNGTGSINANGEASGTGFTSNPSSPTNGEVFTLTSVTDANGCITTSGFTGGSATAMVYSTPTITLGATPATVCAGTSTTQAYSGTTNLGASPKYSIVWSSGALAQGFANVTLATLPATQITIATPGAAVGGSYAGTLTVTNGTTTCTSTGYSISVTVNTTPAAPATPTVVQGCYLRTGSITETGSAPGGVTWYWETSATGTGTTLPGNTPYAPTTTNTYYIRAYNGTCWSPATSVSYITGNGLSGTYTVGTGGNFTTLTAASAWANNYGLCSSTIFSLTNTSATGYDDAGEGGLESYPITFNALTGAGPTVTLTIQAATTATLTESDYTSGIFDFESASYIILNGGSGSSRNLTIQSGSDGDNTIYYDNSCVGDVINNCNILAYNADVYDESPNIYFTGSGAAQATITNCNIHDFGYASGGFAFNGIYSDNNNALLTITNNNIYNCLSTGVNLVGCADACIITGNSFYFQPVFSFGGQNWNTDSYTGEGLQQAAISVVYGSGHTISGNYIGGQSASGGAASTPWTISTYDPINYDYAENLNGVEFAPSFFGIYLATNESSPTASTVSNNVIQNISLTDATGGNSLSAYAIGINCPATVTGNTIGNSSTNLGITLGGAGSTDWSQFTGIGVNLTGSATVSNNIVSNIIANGSAARNTDGNGYVYVPSNQGIFYFNGVNGIISNNQISNLSSTAKTAMAVSTTPASVAANKVATSSDNSDYFAAVIGIEVSNLNSTSTTGMTVSGNTVYNLHGTTTATAVTGVVGIGLDASSGNAYDNKIYGLTNTSTATSTYPGVVGTRVWGGTGWNVYNNQIILSNTNNATVFGMSDVSGQTEKYYFNSVYIGGSGTGPISAAFNQQFADNNITLDNNILYNTRSATGGNYAIDLNLATAPTAFTSNYNELYVSGSPAYIGLKGTGTNETTFANWQGAYSGDANSVNKVVYFNQSTPPTTDLTPSSASNCALYGKGIAITSGTYPPSATNAGITLDYTGVTTRNNPPDIGAIEFTNTFPVISAGTNQTVCYNTSAALAGTQPPADGMAVGAWTPTAGITYSPNAATYNASITAGLAVGPNTETWTVTDGSCTGNSSVIVTLNPQLVAPAISGTNVVCNGQSNGSISVSTPASGGSGPYTYSLNGGTYQSGTSFTGLAPNSYSVVAKDNAGCFSSASNSITLSQPGVLGAATITETDVVCYGAANGTVTVSVIPSGGTTPYLYSLNSGSYQSGTSFGSLAPSSYSVVTKDANGCISAASNTVTVNQPGATSATANNGGPYTVGQTIGLSASSAGATGYAWSGPNGYTGSGQTPSITGATTAMAGIYTVTATNASGCTATASTNVVVTTTATYTWTGATGTTDWTNPSNWVPTAPAGGPNACAIDVIIPSVLHNPIISGVGISVGNLQMNSGSQLTLSGANISVCKNLTGGSGGNAAVIGDGVVVLTGSTLQTFTGYFSMQELMLSNEAGASMLSNSEVDLFTSLDLQTGNFDATNGNLTFKSNTVDSVAILDNFSPTYTGTITGNITAERYYAASGTLNQHYMGSPINSPSLVNQFGASGTGGGQHVQDTYCNEMQSNPNSPYGTVFQLDQNYGYNCGIEQWVVLTSGNAQNGLGYSLLKPGTGKLVLNGEANLNDNYQLTGLQNMGWSNVTMQGRPQTSGWQLLSNPYLATLDLSTVPTGFDNQIQVWNAEGPFQGTFQPGLIGSNAVVSPFQGFMVHKTAVGGSATYTLNATDRVRTPATFYQQNANELKIIAANNTTGLLDQTTVAFNSAATDTFDAQYDAQKMGGSLGRHTIYTVNNNKWMAINALQSVATTSTVPVGFEPGKTGAFTFNFNGVNTFDPTSYIYLEDRTTTQWYNVRNGNYSFNADSADAWNRFVLHFTPAALINTIDATCNTAGTINIQQPGSAYWNYTLLDGNNAIVTTGTLNEAQPVTIQVASGSYTLTLTDTNNYVAVKSIQVNGPAPVSAGFLISADTVEPQQTIVLTATTTGAASYQWNLGNGTEASGATAMVNYTQPGVYVLSLMVTGQSGCSSTQTRTITVANPSATGLTGLNSSGNVKIWSNENKVYVDFNNLHLVGATVIIYDILGQQISNENVTAPNLVYQKEISNIEASYFIVMVKNDDKITAKKVFIINSK